MVCNVTGDDSKCRFLFLNSTSIHDMSPCDALFFSLRILRVSPIVDININLLVCTCSNDSKIALTSRPICTIIESGEDAWKCERCSCSHFVCSVCNITFNRRGDYNRHNGTKHALDQSTTERKLLTGEKKKSCFFFFFFWLRFFFFYFSHYGLIPKIHFDS